MAAPSRPAAEIARDVAAWYTHTFAARETVVTEIHVRFAGRATVVVSFPDRDNGPWTPAPVSETVEITVRDGVCTATITTKYRRHVGFDRAAPDRTDPCNVARAFGVKPDRYTKPDNRIRPR